MGVSWENRVPYVDIYDRTQTPSIEVILAQRHLQWVGHVVRMPNHRLPDRSSMAKYRQDRGLPADSRNASRTI